MGEHKFARSAEGRRALRGVVEAGALVMMLASGATQAALHDRGGCLVYDDVLNVTWLADANFVRTSGYDEDGLITWSAAGARAEQLTYDYLVDGVTLAIYVDWRLPAVRDAGSANYLNAFSGTDYGYNVRTLGSGGTVYSELAYMYYRNLGFEAYDSAEAVIQGNRGIIENDYSGGEEDGAGANRLVRNP